MAKETELVLLRHKLLVGQHQGPDYSKTPVKGRYPTKTYSKGETVFDPNDLEKKFGSDKFRKFDTKLKAKPSLKAEPVEEEVEEEIEETLEEETSEEVTPPQQSLDEAYGKLDDLSAKQLLKVAEAEGVTVPQPHTRSNILKILRKHERGE